MGILFPSAKKNKQFKYSPVFYNEIKDRMKAREARNMQDSNPERYRAELKEQLHHRWEKHKKIKGGKTSFITMILILVAVLFGIYILLIKFFGLLF